MSRWDLLWLAAKPLAADIGETLSGREGTTLLEVGRNFLIFRNLPDVSALTIQVVEGQKEQWLVSREQLDASKHRLTLGLGMHNLHIYLPSRTTVSLADEYRGCRLLPSDVSIRRIFNREK